MKLPWDSSEEQERIEKLESKIEALEADIESWKSRYEAEKERRSSLSAEKQEAQEDLNRLQDKVESLESTSDTEEEIVEAVTEDIKFESAARMVEKLGSINYEEDDLVTVYCRDLSDLPDFKGLKNTINAGQLERLNHFDSKLGLLDRDLGDFVLAVRPFFEDSWSSGESFGTRDLKEFISEEKVWVLVSAGDTKIVKEASGDPTVIDEVKTRVDRKHGSGGFSQGRFQRKREEQVDRHIEAVEEAVDQFDKMYLLGDRRMCSELDGEYLGGFDPNKRLVDALYDFRLLKAR